jgi:hypothetical protein
MNFYFVYDEYTDVVDVSTASTISQRVINTIHGLDTELSDPTDILTGMIREYVTEDLQLQLADNIPPASVCGPALLLPCRLPGSCASEIP